MKRFNCNVLGHNCDKVLTARTEDRLVELVSVHLRDVHGVTAIAPDAMAKIKNSFAYRADSDAADVVDRIFEKYNCSKEPECTWRYIVEAEMILNGGAKVHERELRAA